MLMLTKAYTRRGSVKNVVLEISQNSQENILFIKSELLCKRFAPLSNSKIFEDCKQEAY